MLRLERTYFEEHKAAWLAKYPGKVVLVKGSNLVGTFNTVEEALTEGARKYGLDSYLVRRLSEEEENVVVPALTLGLLRGDPSHSI